MNSNSVIKSIFFVLLSCLILNCKISHQVVAKNQVTLNCNNEYDTILKRTVYFNTDTMPVFQNGKMDFLKYLREHFSVIDKDEFQGTMHFVFVIDTDGKPIGVRIKNKPFNQMSNIEKEGVKIISNMPIWKPGKCQGNIVPVKVNIPMVF